MFKIGEFSKLVKVSARMLRHYEACGLLQPAEIDRFTGYRLYSATQIPLLMRIVTLRDMGFGVEEIAEFLPNFHDATIMKQALEQKQHEVHATIAAEQSKLEKIAEISDNFEKEYFNMVYDVELKSLQAEQVLSLRETIPAEKEEALWGKLWAFIAENDVQHTGGGYSTYYGDEYEEHAVDTEIAVPVSEFGESKGGFQYKELPAIPQAAAIRFSGSYEGYAPAMGKLALWIEQNGYEICGTVRGFAIASPTDVASPADYMTELQVPIQKA
ncbi:MAG: MerR family transcriptional regulator [Oscillospiraceae bacterium]|nr:MerR family transcriptional regulator [Oscillospiraceae bacterium]